MVKPEISLSTLCYLSDPFKKMTENVAKIETDFVEIVDDGFHTLNRQRVSALQCIGASYGLKYSVHAPFADMNIASSSKPMLKAMLRRLEISIANADALEAYLWVFHPGSKTGISMFYPGMDWLQNLKTVHQISKIAKDYDVKIAIENMPEPFPFLIKSVEDFTRFYEEIDEDIGLVLDVGHANLNGQIERFLTVFADKIVHIHAHDNDGKSDRHLGIGYGTIDWKNFLDKLQEIPYSKVVVVESVEHAQESMRVLKQLLG